MIWHPSIGAWREGEKTKFRVWAPEARQIALLVETAAGQTLCLGLRKSADGYFDAATADAKPGDKYQYQIDGRGPFPDPASRAQPRGVHGPSQIVDPASFEWSDANWEGIALEDVILYELHVGTFTPKGTFAGAAEKLPVLRDLGITAVEVMPVADFPGTRNWGYDGVSLFAPARCYGTPDDLRRFVDAAHRIGLAVHLDVVYNHLGPDGAYHGVFSPDYASKTHRSPWGAALNFDGPNCGPVRDFFIENALHWIHEYHMDGLRLDATHAIVDDSPRHFLAELTARVRESLAGSHRKVILAAEDVRNLAYMVKPEAESGWGLDAVWSDDFHHQMRRYLAGDRDGYFEDFQGTAADLATTARQGWYYTGQHAPFFGGPRGTDPAGIAPRRFVFFIQNHDQVGNRAFGDRLHHSIEMAAYRAATALLLTLPETPLLFMGQEWAASSPFQYFTDHEQELGRLVTEGRRNEFRKFTLFADPEKRESIPDPQDPQTFQRSRLHWEEVSREPHQATLRFYQAMLSLRRREAALRGRTARNFSLLAPDADTILLRRESDAGGGIVLLVARLRGAGQARLRETALADLAVGRKWAVLLTSEEAAFAPDPADPQIDLQDLKIDFARPGAVLLKSTDAPAEGGD